MTWTDSTKRRCTHCGVLTHRSPHCMRDKPGHRAFPRPTASQAEQGTPGARSSCSAEEDGK